MNLSARMPWRNLLERRRAFQSRRRENPQSAAQFLAQAAVDDDDVRRELVPAIRAAVARACAVPAESLHAGDTTTELEQLFGADCFGEFLLAIPLGIPESAEGDEFLQYLDDAISPFLGDGPAVSLELFDQAAARWRAGEALGAWAAWLARELATPSSPPPRCRDRPGPPRSRSR